MKFRTRIAWNSLKNRNDFIPGRLSLSSCMYRSICIFCISSAYCIWFFIWIFIIAISTNEIIPKNKPPMIPCCKADRYPPRIYLQASKEAQISFWKRCDSSSITARVAPVRNPPATLFQLSSTYLIWTNPHSVIVKRAPHIAKPPIIF